MSFQADDREVAAVSKLSAPDRYRYFVRKAADCREVWGVAETGWKLLKTDTGEILVPVWPASAFALACCVGEWKSCSPAPILLEAWMDGWIPRMILDARRVAVFPLPDGHAVPVDPQRLADDIQEEMSNFLE